MSKKQTRKSATRGSSPKSPASKPESGRLAPGPATTERPESPQSLLQSMRDIQDSFGVATSKGEILETGREAAELLSSPIFQDAQEMVLSSITALWLQSADEETQLRENLYLQAKNLNLVTEMLVLAVNAAQQENLTEQEQAEQDLLRYQDEQGFGLDGLAGHDDHNGGFGPLN